MQVNRGPTQLFVSYLREVERSLRSARHIVDTS